MMMTMIMSKITKTIMITMTMPGITIIIMIAMIIMIMIIMTYYLTIGMTDWTPSL